MIGLLRFVGLMNAAVWFGAAVFFAVGVGPAASSPEIRELLGVKNYPYFSGAIGHILMSRYFILHTVCGLVALAHMAGEWLYLSKRPGRLLGGLLAVLLLAGLLGGYWIEPRLSRLHTAAHAVNMPSAQRQKAQASLDTWGGIYRFSHVLLLCGLGFYLWRVSNPSDPARFVSATVFRG